MEVSCLRHKRPGYTVLSAHFIFQVKESLSELGASNDLNKECFILILWDTKEIRK